MLPRLLAAVLVLSSAPGADTRLVRETEALDPEQERAALHAPEGFEVRLFASEPMVNKPINMAFDARGRLWVSSTVEYPYSADKRRWSDTQGSRVEGSRDAIKILEDTNGDGSADKATDFAGGLNIPTGVLPWHKPEHRAGCIAWSIPNIWYFADTDGDDKADLREVLFGPLGYEKDTHGMCSSFRLGQDGWVYATHGFNNTSHLKARDGSILDLHSGNVFRFRPDGSHVEIWSWGQVNPFGLCFDRHHNLYSADCHSAPIYQLLRGACYPSFGKPHDGLGFGPVMCEHSHGSTGICGIVYIDGDIWGTEWDDHTLVGNVVTSRVNHDRITFSGSTPKANEEADFITSDDPWFRPVDLQLGPDNALYIADFYNKIIGHYEVPLDHPGRDKERGRIWRVSKHNAPSTQREPQATGIGNTREAWIAALADPSPFKQRAALAALQNEPSLVSLPALIQFAIGVPSHDPQLLHAAKLSLREHLKLPGAFTSQPGSIVTEIAPAVPTSEAAEFLLGHLGSLPEPRAALTHIAKFGEASILAKAIQMARQREKGAARDQVAAIKALQDGFSERGSPPHPELLQWAQEVAVQLLDAPVVTHWEPVPQTAPAPVWSLVSRKCSDGMVTEVLQSMKGGGNEEKLTGVLRSRVFLAPATLRFWINGHRGFPAAPAHDKNLVRLVEAGTGKILAGVFPPRDDRCEPVTWDLAPHAGKRVHLEIVDGDDGRAYAWLGITRIDPPVADISSFQGEDATRTALRTLATLLQQTAPAALREKLAAYLPPRPAPPPLPVSPEQRRQLDNLIAQRTAAFAKATPDVAKGRQVFTVNCAACHQIAGQGGLIGPQLDGIGNRGLERLCEDILDPNRNVDAHFHLHTLKLKDGLTNSGFLRAEAGQITILADAAGQEHRVPKSEILEDQILPMSVMPPIFGQSIPEPDFLNLLAWLLKK